MHRATKTFRRRVLDGCAVAGCLLLCLAFPEIVLSQEEIQREKVLVRAENPDPKTLPTLHVFQRPRNYPKDMRSMTLVASTFPNAPDFTCDSWCYESALEFTGATATSGGRLELRHRVLRYPHVVLVTTVTPEPGAVEFVARPELDRDAVGEVPDGLLLPNLCWQLIRAPAFASKPDPYPDFAKRCFIFTARGRTFLDKTERRNLPSRPEYESMNNPVWAQMYTAVWGRFPEIFPRWSSNFPATVWSEANSPDRYTTPVIGTVSRDGKHLAALGNGSAETMLQAFHDCLHNNPEWLPSAAPPAQRAWRLKMYVMENDSEALLMRVARDFPTLSPRASR